MIKAFDSFIALNIHIKIQLLTWTWKFIKSVKLLWHAEQRTPGQLEFPYVDLQFLGYIFENRNGSGRRRTHHNKTYIPSFFSLSCAVPVSDHFTLINLSKFISRAQNKSQRLWYTYSAYCRGKPVRAFKNRSTSYITFSNSKNNVALRKTIKDNSLYI